MTNQPLTVEIKTPEKVIATLSAEWVSSVNSQGPFDILGLHANFITIVEKAPIRIKSGSEVKEYTFSRSVIYTHKNVVKIYCNI